MVAADVIDLAADTVRADDVFFVDTNVWLWMTYSRASHDASYYQLSVYPKYLQAALQAKATLHHCGLTLAELAHVIERSEHKVYNSAATGYGGTPKEKKDLRQDTKHRQSVVAEISSAWQQVKKMSSAIDIKVDADAAEAALKRLTATTLDAYDSLMLEVASGCPQIITDDADFCSVPGIKVFTGNSAAIKAAKWSGKLVAR